MVTESDVPPGDKIGYFLPEQSDPGKGLQTPEHVSPNLLRIAIPNGSLTLARTSEGWRVTRE